METLIVSMLFLLGLGMTIKGGDWFVESAIWLAKVTGIPNVIIGATVVSIATTLPELLVSTIATYQRFYDVAIGNVVGSVICNIGLILGLTAVLTPVKIQRSTFSIKGIFMIISCLLLFFTAANRMITPREGTVFLIFFAIYIGLNIIELKHSNRLPNRESVNYNSKGAPGHHILKFLGGALFVIGGARLLVTQGVVLAQIIGIPEQIVSLTLIALGTSLPELITAISAVVKKQQGISVGNIIGASILNLLMVIGISSKLSNPGIVISYQNVMLGATIYNIPQTLYFDLPVAAILIAILVLGGIVFSKINRILGAIILGIYCAYLFILARLFM
ncbi:calcium/sodium antiporter [Alkaliphilus crotonatoxidans]